MKKILIYILMIGICLSSFNIQVFSAGVYDEINSEQDFFNYLKLMDIEPKNVGDKIANYETFKRYDQVVYGSPWGDVKDGERRYLGYNLINSNIILYR